MTFKYIGRSQHPMTYSSFHKHPNWELIYNVHGKGTMVIGEEKYPFFEGCILLCPPGMAHCKQSEEPFEDYYLTFSGDDLSSKVCCFEDTHNQEIFHILQAMYSFYHQDASQAIYLALFDALMHIIKPQFAQKETDKYVSSLKQIIVASFTDPTFSLEKACSAIPQNVDHLRRNFKRFEGVTPHRYLTHLRIEYAKHILTESPGMKVYIREVAMRCGFNDPLYFSKLFKKETGVAPSQWK